MPWRGEPHVSTDGPEGVTLPFADRAEAGRLLARWLKPLDLTSPVVLALPRGGVAVGYEIAHELGGTLDVLLTRKIGCPSQPELGVGALAEGAEPVFDHRILDHLGLTEEDLAATVTAERAELDRRVQVYRGGRGVTSLPGRDVVVVDDGLATGGTARAALRAVRSSGPRRVVLAVPVSAAATVTAMQEEADAVLALATPPSFRAVGQWFQNFEQLTDTDVVALLRREQPG